MIVDAKNLKHGTVKENRSVDEENRSVDEENRSVDEEDRSVDEENRSIFLNGNASAPLWFQPVSGSTTGAQHQRGQGD